MTIKSTSLCAFSFLALCLPFLAGCPKKPAETAPTEGEYRRPDIVHPADESTPERQAAAELMNNGINALQEENWEEAEWHFQEAIRIAPSYGPPYYWLARTKYTLEEMTQAWDLLDKAELLIGHDPDWLERIDQLRQAISSEQSSTSSGT